MALRPLEGACGFALGAALRAALGGALAIGVVVALQHQYFLTALVLSAAVGLVVLDLVRSTRAADDALAQFVVGLMAEGYERPTVPAGFRRLGGAVAVALDRLETTRAERQQRTDFAEALVDTVSAALIVVDRSGAVVAANRTARNDLRAEIGPIRATKSLGAPAARRLLALPIGAREIVRLADRRAVLAQVSGFTASGRALRLIALQGVSKELDAVEVKAWEDLVRVLAHELMNSLAPICALSENAATKLGGADADPELVKAIEVIARRSQGLMTFVERYRRLTGAPRAVKSQISAAQLVTRLDQLAAAMIEADPIDYRSVIRPPWLSVEVDVDLLEQAMINLLKNAFDAVRGRPDARVRLSCTLDEGQVTFAVADNGPGLPSGDPDRVFVPFFTTKAAGSGIGLTLARQIAIAHGGRLEHRPATPSGAVFELVLPTD